MNCKNKKCKEEISERKPLHFSNQIAQKLGYCSFTCLSEHLGNEKALKALQIAESAENAENRANTGERQ